MSSGQTPRRPICPECRDGKPWNCVGQALNEDDEFVPCEGPEAP